MLNPKKQRREQRILPDISLASSLPREWHWWMTTSDSSLCCLACGIGFRRSHLPFPLQPTSIQLSVRVIVAPRIRETEFLLLDTQTKKIFMCEHPTRKPKPKENAKETTPRNECSDEKVSCTSWSRGFPWWLRLFSFSLVFFSDFHPLLFGTSSSVSCSRC